ncbi:MAG: sulfate/thiosulfate transport system permease protein [Moorella sp. (in: firmicutes)]|uniref:Sulfate transport system permease protein CysT n=1 Tax=Neomoorella thermoacetica TaxID=1525 RepID=A0A1J5NNU4_NEOTH|nr:sulfate/thiosulfate transport system permease protein [Moorella sp. (in: firmicutes)]OIQ60857.1 sulfate transport system permease protein CysT [Moorella thermoacetica]
MAKEIKGRVVLPGFGMTLGVTLFYVSVMILLPFAALVLKSASLSLHEFYETVTAPRVTAALRLSLLTAWIAASINVVFGVPAAWVLSRYSFPGKRLLDAMVDLPFALPTAVAGIALTAMFGPTGGPGAILGRLGVKIAFTPAGIVVALVFIGLPFVVRTLQPVIESLDRRMEEAAATLGASPAQVFFRVILPPLVPALLSGFSLAFARGIGEYGSVVFISGNMPMRTEIAPLVIMTKLQQFDYAGATAVAVVLLIVSFIVLSAVRLMELRAGFWRTGVR